MTDDSWQTTSEIFNKLPQERQKKANGKRVLNEKLRELVDASCRTGQPKRNPSGLSVAQAARFYVKLKLECFFVHLLRCKGSDGK